MLKVKRITMIYQLNMQMELWKLLLLIGLNNITNIIGPMHFLWGWGFVVPQGYLQVQGTSCGTCLCSFGAGLLLANPLFRVI